MLNQNILDNMPNDIRYTSNHLSDWMSEQLRSETNWCWVGVLLSQHQLG